MCIINKSTGHPKIIGLGFTKLRHQDASTTRDAMFSQLARHGVSKETAKLKLACIGVDGAAVNLGQFKGLKALMQKNPTDARTDPSLEYWGWYWVVLVHCINHLLELGIGDLKGADPYVLEFSENLQKVFKMYYYSSVLEADREELAFLTDDDFTTLGGLNQIRWAPSQYRALAKLDKNFKNLTQHCENVAATGNHERKEEFEGALCFLTSLKFVKMMLFMMDMHSILKFVSKYFQREEILIIEVEPLLQRAYIALENLRGGKGNKMLQFAETFPQSGKRVWS